MVSNILNLQEKIIRNRQDISNFLTHLDLQKEHPNLVLLYNEVTGYKYNR